MKFARSLAVAFVLAAAFVAPPAAAIPHESPPPTDVRIGAPPFEAQDVPAVLLSLDALSFARAASVPATIASSIAMRSLRSPQPSIAMDVVTLTTVQRGRTIIPPLTLLTDFPSETELLESKDGKNKPIDIDVEALIERGVLREATSADYDAPVEGDAPVAPKAKAKTRARGRTPSVSS